MGWGKKRLELSRPVKVLPFIKDGTGRILSADECTQSFKENFNEHFADPAALPPDLLDPVDPEELLRCELDDFDCNFFDEYTCVQLGRLR